MLDRETAHLCCLASDCNEPAYTRLVKGLCHQNNISLLMVPTGQELGEWCGICKIDEDGNPRKVTRQSGALTTCMLILFLTPSLVALCVFIWYLSCTTGSQLLGCRHHQLRPRVGRPHLPPELHEEERQGPVSALTSSPLLHPEWLIMVS